jgi:hypothetical protein
VSLLNIEGEGMNDDCNWSTAFARSLDYPVCYLPVQTAIWQVIGCDLLLWLSFEFFLKCDYLLSAGRVLD